MSDSRKNGWRIEKVTDPGWGPSDPGRKSNPESGCDNLTVLFLALSIAASQFVEAFS